MNNLNIQFSKLDSTDINNILKSHINNDYKYQFENLGVGLTINGGHLCVTEDAVFHKLNKPYIAFVFLLEGEVNFSLNRIRYSISAGDNGRFIAVITRDITLFTRYLYKGECTKKITISGIERWINPLNFDANTVVDWALNDEYKNLAKSLINNETNNLDRDVEAINLVHSCKNHFLKDLLNSVQQSKQPDDILLFNEQRLLLENSIKNCLENGTSDIKEIASLLNTSQRTLQRKVRKYFQCSVKELVHNEIMQKALIALGEKKLSIGETAYLCGYTQPSNFIQAFKKHYGVTPGNLLK